MNCGGLWVAHERANLRPPGVERRHVKLDWEVMPDDHPVGGILTQRSHEARIALDEALSAVDQAVFPAAVASGAGQLAMVNRRITWETIEPTTSLRRPDGPSPLPVVERRPTVAR